MRPTILLASVDRPEAGGFTFHACRTAACWSVLLTGGGLSIFQTVSAQLALPGAFFIKLTLFICCASFAISYWIIAGAAAGEPAAA